MATIDDRLDRLTERHEALTQSVELQGHNIDALTVKMDAFQNAAIVIVSQLDRVVATIERLAETVGQIAAIALDHERRLGRLEN